jgi:hypothetical protein
MISMNKSDYANLICAEGKNMHASHEADNVKSVYSYFSSIG